MPVALPDILSTDGRHLFMRAQSFDMQGKPVEGGVPHLFSPSGFTDDTWFHRSYWVYGPAYHGGCGGYSRAGKVSPSGRILACDDQRVYGFGRKPAYFRWTTPLEYQLFAAHRTPTNVEGPDAAKRPGKGRRRGGSGVKFAWTQDIPLLAWAMVVADKTLFIAGPEAVINEREALQQLGADAVEVKAKIAEQEAALAGRQGAVLWAVSTEDGSRLAESPLEVPPAFDGMAAADGRLFIATMDGKVLCLGEVE
jgi:hypothetical protein